MWAPLSKKTTRQNFIKAEIISMIVTRANDSWIVASDLIVDDSLNDTAKIYTTRAEQVNPLTVMDLSLLIGLTFNDYVGYLYRLGYNKNLDEVDGGLDDKLHWKESDGGRT